MTLTTKVLETFKEPFVFEPLHKSVREPFDYYRSFMSRALPRAPPRAVRRAPAAPRRGVARSRVQHGVRFREGDGRPEELYGPRCRADGKDRRAARRRR